jgi:hypothetical protein
VIFGSKSAQKRDFLSKNTPKYHKNAPLPPQIRFLWRRRQPSPNRFRIRRAPKLSKANPAEKSKKMHNKMHKKSEKKTRKKNGKNGGKTAIFDRFLQFLI